MTPREKRPTGLLQGLLYGLLPHTFCILFIALSIVGATAATSLLKRLFYLPYFIEIVIALAFVFATLSALFYLKKNGLLSWAGIKFKARYLAVLYATTIAVNLLFFWVVFPAVANLDLSRAGGGVVQAQQGAAVTLAVEIPCSGHAPLVIGELEQVAGVLAVRYQSPNLFEVTYDAQRVSLEEILAQPVFQSFAAVVKP